VATKKCPQCRQETSNFSKDASRRNGLAIYCRDCKKSRVVAYKSKRWVRLSLDICEEWDRWEKGVIDQVELLARVLRMTREFANATINYVDYKGGE
jgi:hypothetical protein